MGIQKEFDGMLGEKLKTAVNGVRGIKVTERHNVRAFDGATHDQDNRVRLAAGVTRPHSKEAWDVL